MSVPASQFVQPGQRAREPSMAAAAAAGVLLQNTTATTATSDDPSSAAARLRDNYLLTSLTAERKPATTLGWRSAVRAAQAHGLPAHAVAARLNRAAR
eukprot:1607767-Pleurochrysis_carterae.AAC.1